MDTVLRDYHAMFQTKGIARMSPLPKPSLKQRIWTGIDIVRTKILFFLGFDSKAEPTLNVEICQAVIVPQQGSPFKRIYLQVNNTGKSPAPRCRAIIRLPEVSAYMLSLTRLPPRIPPGVRGFEARGKRLKDIELDWFRPGMAPPEDEHYLGKSVDISPHPNDVLLAGTIIANKVEVGPIHTVNAKLEILVNTPENWPAKGKISRPLMELYAGNPLEVKTILTWEKEQVQEKTFRWELQVVSFDDIRFIPVSSVS